MMSTVALADEKTCRRSTFRAGRAVVLGDGRAWTRSEVCLWFGIVPLTLSCWLTRYRAGVAERGWRRARRSS
jgi:hypothetical protein